MRAYFNKTWREYILLLLLLIVIPTLLMRFSSLFLSSSPELVYYFIVMPILCGLVITITSSKINAYDWAAIATVWLLPLLLNFMLSGFKIAYDPCMPIHYALIILLIPALEAFAVSGIASIIVLHKKRKGKEGLCM